VTMNGDEARAGSTEKSNPMMSHERRQPMPPSAGHSQSSPFRTKSHCGGCGRSSEHVWTSHQTGAERESQSSERAGWSCWLEP
jgi:hypothetical protein